MKKIFTSIILILIFIDNITFAWLVPWSLRYWSIKIPAASCSDNTSNACDDWKSWPTSGDTADWWDRNSGWYFRTHWINDREGSDSNCKTNRKYFTCPYSSDTGRFTWESRCQTTSEKWMRTSDTDCNNPWAWPNENYQSFVEKYDNSSYRTIDKDRDTLCYNYWEAKDSGENYNSNTKVMCQTYCRAWWNAACWDFWECYWVAKYWMIDDESPEYCPDSDDNTCYWWDKIFSKSTDEVWCNVDEYVRWTYTSWDKLNWCKIITWSNSNTDLLQNIKFFVRDKSGIRRIRIQLWGCYADYENTNAISDPTSAPINTWKIYFTKDDLLKMFNGNSSISLVNWWSFTRKGSSLRVKTSSNNRLDETCLWNWKNYFSLEVWDWSLTNNWTAINWYATSDFWKWGWWNNTWRYNTVIHSQKTANIDSNNSFVNISWDPAVITDPKWAAKSSPVNDVWKNVTTAIQTLFWEDVYNSWPKNSSSSSQNCYVSWDWNSIKCSGDTFNLEYGEPSICASWWSTPCFAG